MDHHRGPQPPAHELAQVCGMPSNRVVQTKDAPSMACRQPTKPHPHQSMEKPFSLEPVPGAQRVGAAGLQDSQLDG